MLRLCEAYAAKNAFQFAPAKCKYISSTEGSMCLYGQPLGRLQSFDYLGMPIGLDGIDTNAHITLLILRGNSMRGMLLGLGYHRLGLDLQTIDQVYKCFIRSSMEYGLAILPLNKGQLLKLQNRQNDHLKNGLGTPPGYPLALLHAIGNVESLETRHASLRTKWIRTVRETTVVDGPGKRPVSSLLRPIHRTVTRQRIA